MEDALHKGVARMQNKPPNPTMDYLRALIKSKGVESPPKNTKKLVLQRLWKQLKDKETLGENYSLRTVRSAKARSSNGIIVRII